jgi:ubiquinone/menaquinone biosynthesis C-methylase UbiE
MEFSSDKPIYSDGESLPTYLDVQATAGVTKHMGGFEATDELHRLCHVDQASEVLEVGCGIGVGPAYIAKRFGCKVVAVDISEKMLSWAQKRARREGVGDRITFRQAGISELPFEDDRFDAVIVESVLAFVEDKDPAIRELIRVTKPGGYIGLNECFWTREPPTNAISPSLHLGPAVITEAEWESIWDAMPLDERSIKKFDVEPKQEVKDRIRWIGWRSILPAWGRILRLMIKKPEWREVIKAQFDSPAAAIDLFGYALLVGRKPA